MEIVIEEVVARVSVASRGAVLDEATLRALVRSVLGALEERDARDRRRRSETMIPDDGRRRGPGAM